MMITKEDSFIIKALRFPCAFLVVMIHSFKCGGNIQETISPIYSNGFYDFIRILFSQGISRVAVPLFFLISGYLFFSKLEDRWSWSIYKEKIKSRGKSLLVPYLLWGLIALFAYTCVFGGKSFINGELSFDNYFKFLSDRGGVLTFWNNARYGFNEDSTRNILGWVMYSSAEPLNYPLWFIRDLIVVTLFSPLVYFLVKKFGQVFTFVLFLLYVCNIWIPYEGFSIDSWFFFSFGGSLRLSQKSVLFTFHNNRYVYYIVSLFLLFVSVGLYGKSSFYGYTIKLFTVFGLVSIYCLCFVGLQKVKFKNSCIFKKLEESSFFLYAMHSIFIVELYSDILNLILGRSNQFSQLLIYLLTPFLTSITIVGIYAILKKHLPRLTSVLTGGR